MRWIAVADVNQIAPGMARAVKIEGRPLALFNVAGVFYAINDLCSHMGGPLSRGRADGNQIVCPWHGARFDVTCGKAMTPPAGRDVQSYAVRVEGSTVLVLFD